MEKGSEEHKAAAGIGLSDVRSAFSGRVPGYIGKHREYSVLVPFVETEDGLSMLYEVRSGDVSQPGEICFPGGRVEQGETFEEAAIRETVEEIGVAESDIELISEGDAIHGNANFTLHTFIGSIKGEALEAAAFDEGEVGEVFFVSLSDLMKAKPSIFDEKMQVSVGEGFPYEKLGVDRNYPWHVPEAEIPVYDIGGRMIWGLTARITMDVLSVLKERAR